MNSPEKAAPSRIFISYRRDDSGAHARRIFAWLKSNLPGVQVFIDMESIAPGDDFLRAIGREIGEAAVVLVVIGLRWCLAEDHEGRLRLDDPHDVVRKEVLTSIRSGLRVIPVLVGGASMPKADDLPEALHPLTKLNAISVDEGLFEESMARLFAVPGPSAIIQGTNADEAAPRGSRTANRTTNKMIKKKICLLGATGVGKTSLVNRFVMQMFSDRYLTTVGVVVSKKIVNVAGEEITLMIWDIAGEEEGHAIRANQVRDASGLILVADICSSASLEAALDIRRRFHDTAPAVLAVNKVDRHEDEWALDLKGLARFERDGLVPFTTSAKTGKGVEEMFLYFARRIVETNYQSDGLEADQG
jgi:hypothetical protein